MRTLLSSGKKAELAVAGYLRSKGAIIAKMNYHSRYGEIDIIAETGKTIMFVEVKFRSPNALFTPREAVDPNKQRKIILTAKDFLAKSNIPELMPRFDVAEVCLEKNEKGEENYKINYIKNAFQA